MEKCVVDGFVAEDIFVVYIRNIGDIIMIINEIDVCVSVSHKKQI